MNTNTVTDRVITIDFGQTLEAMIAAGNYDWVDPDITATTFPVQGLGSMKFEARLFHFDRDISSEEAVELITHDASWEPAKIEQLLAYGAAYPEELRKYPIIGLGSVAGVSGHRSLPYLRWSGAGCILDLGWWDDDWYGAYRFLGVRKLATAA